MVTIVYGGFNYGFWWFSLWFMDVYGGFNMFQPWFMGFAVIICGFYGC